MVTSCTLRHRLLRASCEAFSPACKTALWVIRMVLPITLGISVLQYLGVIGWISAAMAPLFGWLGLPGDSGLVFITALLSNNYAAVAVIATLGFDYRSVVILAVMAVICHNLIIESVIQGRTGVSAWKMALLRLLVAFAAAGILNLILPEHLSGELFLPRPDVLPDSWSETILGWIRTTGPLCIMIFGIIVILNVLQSIMREFHWLDLLSVPLRPLLSVFGLPRSSSFLWIICNIVGLTYGGAALVDEVQRGGVSHHDARLLNSHVAISHSLLEDTLIFYSIGVGLFWLLVPRMLLALCVVWIFRVVLRLHRTTQHAYSSDF